MIKNLYLLNFINFFLNSTTVFWSWKMERVCRHHLTLKGNTRPASISSFVIGCIFEEIHVNLSHAQHCSSNMHPLMLSCWNLVPWSSARYKQANTIDHQLKFETLAKSLNNGKYIKCTRLAYVFDINILPISMRMWARAYCPFFLGWRQLVISEI